MPKIKLRGGLEANIPVLDEREPAFTTDTEKLFIGSKDGNVQFAKQSDLTTTNANVTTNTANIATNTANIATNTANIATNTTNIASNTASLAEIAIHIKDFATLQSTLTSVGSQLTTLLIPTNITITSNITIPSNVNLWFSPSGMLSVNSGVTLTINGYISAGMWQIFGGTGTVNGSPKITWAYAEWFGAVINNTSVDNAPIIQTTLNFFHKVHLTKGVYYLNSTVTLPYGATLLGIGRLTYTGYDDTTIFQQANVPAFTFANGAGMVTLDNFVIKGNTANANNDGILFNSYGSYSVLRNLLIYQCGGHGIHAAGSASTGVDLVQISSVKVDSCTGYGIKLEIDHASGNGFNTSLFEVVECMRNGMGGFYFDQANDLTLIRCHAWWNANGSTVYGYSFGQYADQIKLINCWSEGNGEHNNVDATHHSGGYIVNGSTNLSFDNCKTFNESNSFIINSGTNIIIDNPEMQLLGYACSTNILIQSAANNVHVKNYNMQTGDIVANFSSSSYIDTTVQLPTSGRISYNTNFKRTQRGKANCYSQGTQPAGNINGTNINGTAGNNYVTYTGSTGFRIGDNITIMGVGNAGGGLVTQITDIDIVNLKIYLATNIITTASNCSTTSNLASVHSEIYASTYQSGIITGAWQIGDIIFVTQPDIRGFSMQVCTVAGTTGTWQNFGYLKAQTPTAFALPNSGTINTSFTTSTRMNPASAVTGIILQAGTYAEQEITVFNESAYSITFAASGSNVADGSSDVISAGTARKFIWNAGNSLWYRIQ